MTDIIDGEKPTAEEFLQNLAAVTAALEKAVTEVIDFINGKCLSELWCIQVPLKFSKNILSHVMFCGP